MSSEKENIELKSKEKNNTDKLNLSGQIVRPFIIHWLLDSYKRPDKQVGQIQFVRVLFFSRNQPLPDRNDFYGYAIFLYDFFLIVCYDDGFPDRINLV